MTVFDLFVEVPFIYLEISRGEVYGNRIVSERQLTGIFKLRAGMTQTGDQETRESNASMHVHPEDFEDVEDIVGNGIRFDDKEYAIIGCTGGQNFDSGAIEHYTLTLERATLTEETA